MSTHNIHFQDEMRDFLLSQIYFKISAVMEKKSRDSRTSSK